MEEAAVSAVIQVGECACTPLKEHMGYLTHFNDNMKHMTDRLQVLVARKADIDQQVSRGCSNGEAVTREVDWWLTQADKMKAEAERIEQRVSENKRCLCCPNLSWRYSISKQAKQMTESIVRHYDNGKFDRVTSPSSPPAVENQPAPSIQGLPSVESSLQKVTSALRDENTKIIGVWGMGGVGKTTLVKNVNNKLQGTQEFKKVIMVTVSKDVDIKKIQGDIAERLGFTLQDGTESSRASKLRSSLMKEETFLIILDDLWERLDLADVGIPPTNSLEGCKIIFTTRYEQVCQRMESQVDIKVEVLSDEESWKLFKEKAAVADNSSLQSKAKEVLKECGGLPLAIITLGRALRGRRNPKEWDNALSQLKKSVPSDIKGMENGVYHSIKISYDHLRPQLKPAFLFCCLFPEDYDIHVDWMIRLWKGEGFLEDVESLEEALNKGHALVEELKSSSLLLEGKEEGYVKMHDIVRDVAIWISSKECKDYKSFVRIGSKGLPQGKSWEEYRRISLWWSVNKLPEGMHCPKLVTLMMPEKQELTEIQGWFWEATKDLRVLDLSRTAISKIPLSNLVNLRLLCLSNCMFKEGICLSALGGLKQLEFLDLSFNYWLRELPNEIGELVNLRSLDLTDTVHLKIVPSGVISRLTLLEELKMWNSFHKWKAEEKDGSSSSSSNACLSEVASLKELSNLHLCIVGVERLPRDYPLIKHPTKLKNFRFCICTRRNYDLRCRAYPGSNPDELRYMEIDGCSLIPEWALRLLPQTTHLKLKDCKGKEALNRGGGFSSLKSLTVYECDDVEFVVSAKESPENAFGNLQSLELRGLPNLKKVVTTYEEGLLHNLKKIVVNGCRELKHLLPSVLLRGMDNLTDVRVSDCEGMEHLFDGPPTMEQRNDVLSKLENLKVEKCPKLKHLLPSVLLQGMDNLTHVRVSYCKGMEHLFDGPPTMEQRNDVLSKLENLKVEKCPKLKHLLPSVLLQGMDNLTDVEVSDCEGMEHLFDGPPTMEQRNDVLSKLENLEVEKCPKLKHLLPSVLLQGMDNLTDVRVSDCDGMEHLFDGPPTMEQRNDVLSKLENLKVEKCPKLKHLLPSVLLQGMDNLTDARVSDCEGMEHLFDGPPTMEQRNDVLSKLETLRLSFLPSMTSIWPMGLVVNLQKLDSLNVWDCHGLKKVLSSNQMKGGLPNLEYASVKDCKAVEEIISDVVDNEGLLPKLKYLTLSYLPELVRIYGGGEAVPPPQLDWHSLKRIDVYGCPKLKKVQPLQGGADSVPSLKEIKGERNWWEGLDWEGDGRVISQFHSLFKQDVALVLGMRKMMKMMHRD